MTQYLQIAQLILSLFPLLIKTIKAIEEAIPGQGNGEAKLAMVRGVIESTYKIGTDVAVSFTELWPALEGAINAIVTGFNVSKTFKK